MSEPTLVPPTPTTFDNTPQNNEPLPFKAPDKMVVKDKPLTAALTATQQEQDAALEMSIFADGRDFKDSGKPVYNLTVKFGKYTFFGNQLSAEQLEYVNRENQALIADSKAVEKLPQDQQEAAGLEIAARSVAKDLWIVEQSLIGWKHSDWSMPPWDAENRAAIAKAVWAQVASDIVAKSLSGRAASDVAANF